MSDYNNDNNNNVVATTTSNNNNNNNRTNNIIVLSDSGKPIFSTYNNNDDDDIGRICGLIQAIRTSITYNQLDDIQSLQSDTLLLVFYIVGSIILVAISERNNNIIIEEESNNNNNNNSKDNNSKDNNNNNNDCNNVDDDDDDDDNNNCWSDYCWFDDTEIYLRLQLEYVYAQIILTLTDQIQTILQHNAGFDVQSILGNNDTTMIRSILHDMETNNINNNDSNNNNPASYIIGGIPVIYPISKQGRDIVSKILQQIGNNTPNTVFAILFIKHSLITIIQPSYPLHQLHTSDIHLILSFLTRQLIIQHNIELWIPICIPRFNSLGFLYCYSHIIDINSTDLSIALFSQDNTTEQFHTFRNASIQLQRKLGISIKNNNTDNNNILHILDYNHDNTITRGNNNNSNNDVEWRRSNVGNDNNSSNIIDDDNNNNIEVEADALSEDEDYELVSYECCNNNNNNDDNYESSSVQLFMQDLDRIRRRQQQQQNNDDNENNNIFKEYIQMGILHFVFRRDVVINNNDNNNNNNGKKHHSNSNKSKLPSTLQSKYLSQCICSSTPIIMNSTGNNNNNTHSKKEQVQQQQRIMWRIYERLHIRLRYGSAAMNTEIIHNAYETITSAMNNNNNGEHSTTTTITKDCLAMSLSERPPTIQSITYEKYENDGTYLAMNGNRFELYLLAESHISPEQIAATGAKLARHILADEDKLFLSNPLTWDESK